MANVWGSLHPEVRPFKSRENKKSHRITGCLFWIPGLGIPNPNEIKFYLYTQQNYQEKTLTFVFVICS